MQQPAVHRRWRNRPLSRERDDRRVRWLWAMLLGMVLAVVPAGAYLVNQNACLKLSYELSSLRTEHEQLLEEERRLKVERASLGSLARIEAWAIHQRGLVDPSADSVLVIRRPGAGAGRLVALGSGRVTSGAVRPPESSRR